MRVSFRSISFQNAFNVAYARAVVLWPENRSLMLDVTCERFQCPAGLCLIGKMSFGAAQHAPHVVFAVLKI